MARNILPEGRAQRIAVISIAAVAVAAFGVAAGGLFLKDDAGVDTGYALASKNGAKDIGANEAAPPILQMQAPKVSKPQGDILSPLNTADPKQTAAQFRVKRVLNVTEPLDHGDYIWDDAGVPDGQIVITVDLKAQTLSVFRGGYEIGVAVILYGAEDKESPLGIFPITQKDADHYSNLYNNAPMPYAMRLTSDGVFIHGSDVLYGEATHGCIGVPTAFAKKLFGQAKLGDIVIITDGKMMNLS